MPQNAVENQMWLEITDISLNNMMKRDILAGISLGPRYLYAIQVEYNFLSI